MIVVGNVNDTPKEKVLWVYDAKTVQPKASIVMQDDMVVTNGTMTEHYIKFSFPYNKRVSFNRPDYLKYNGITYRLREDCQPVEVDLQQYTYEPRFDAPEMFFLDCIMFYTMQGYQEVEWVLFGQASQFMEIAVDNINKQLHEDWKLGIVEPGDFDLQNITFDSQNVFDALTAIAEAFSAEWYVDYKLKTINLVYQHEDGDIITLRREIQLKDIKKAKESEGEPCTRLFAFGSTRNIPKNYRHIDEGVVDAIVQKKLRLPVEVGDYIDAKPNLETLDVISKVKTFEHIYPKRIGNITSVRIVEKKDEGGNPFIIYYIKDSGLKFKSDYILPNETLMLQFGNNSWLNGRDFELSYNDKTEEFEIVNIEEGEHYLPNDILKPKVGDEYVLYGFDISLVGAEYVPLAEKELEDAAHEYLELIATDTATYTCTVFPVYKFENNLDLELGQRVRLKSVMFEEGEKLSRVFGYRKYPVTGLDEYDVGDTLNYNRLERMENQVEENKKVADVQHLEAMKLSNNAYQSAKALGYLRRALENETSIDGGLILTSLIRLGMMVGDVWEEKAGTSGIAESDEDIAFWAGGTLEQAIKTVANPEAIFDIAKYVVTHGGKTILNDAFMRGKFESNSRGSRIVIDPEDKSVSLLVNNIVLSKWNFHVREDEDEGVLYAYPALEFNEYSIDTERRGLSSSRVDDMAYSSTRIQKSRDGLHEERLYADIGGGQITLSKYVGEDRRPVARLNAAVSSYNDTFSLQITNLPKSSERLAPGEVWVDGDVLKIVPERD